MTQEQNVREQLAAALEAAKARDFVTLPALLWKRAADELAKGDDRRTNAIRVGAAGAPHGGSVAVGREDVEFLLHGPRPADKGPAIAADKAPAIAADKGPAIAADKAPAIADAKRPESGGVK